MTESPVEGASQDDPQHFIVELDASEVDASRLGPALSALGGLVADANQELYPDQARIAVRVRPFERGSFLVDFAMSIDPTAAAGLFAAMGPDLGTKIKTILEVLGLIRGGATNVLDVIRRLKGTPPRVTPLSQEEFRYEAEGNMINVNAPVHNLYQNPVVHQNFYMFARPVESPDVSQEQSYLRGHKDTSVVTLTKPDADIIRRTATLMAKPPVVVATDPQPAIVHLNPKRGPFEAVSGKWSFKMGDATIQAKITDSDFLERYGRGEIRLNHADLLTVELVTTQRVQGTAVKTLYEIRRVIEYQKAPGQQDLAL